MEKLNEVASNPASFFLFWGEAGFEATNEDALKLGYPSLRPEQLEVAIQFYLLSGRDVFAVLPTGFGKSLCFAVLPLAFDKLSYFFSNRRLADIHLCTAAVAFHNRVLFLLLTAITQYDDKLTIMEIPI